MSGKRQRAHTFYKHILILMSLALHEAEAMFFFSPISFHTPLFSMLFTFFLKVMKTDAASMKFTKRRMQVVVKKCCCQK
jgi:hypothetical protein